MWPTGWFRVSRSCRRSCRSTLLDVTMFKHEDNQNHSRILHLHTHTHQPDPCLTLEVRVRRWEVRSSEGESRAFRTRGYLTYSPPNISSNSTPFLFSPLPVFTVTMTTGTVWPFNDLGDVEVCPPRHPVSISVAPRGFNLRSWPELQVATSSHTDVDSIFGFFFFLSFLNNCVDRLTSIWSICPGRVLRNSQKEVGGRESVESEYFYGHDGVNEVKGVISITCKLNYSLIRFIWEERRFNSTFCRKSQPQEWGTRGGGGFYHRV